MPPQTRRQKRAQQRSRSRTRTPTRRSRTRTPTPTLPQSPITTIDFFTPEMIAEISSRPVMRDYLKSNHLKLQYLENEVTSDGVHMVLATDRPTTRSGVTYEQILDERSILFERCAVGINGDYVRKGIADATEKIFREQSTNFDIVFLMTTKTMMHGKKTIPANTKVGLIIVEKGECSQHPNIPVLKIICSLEGLSTVLMYSYLYIIKKQGYNMGLLELAGCYFNIRGLCSYDRFGFEEDYELKNTRCFSEEPITTKRASTLPMSVDMRNVSYKDLDDVLLKKKRLGDEPLCDKTYMDKANEKEQFEEIERRELYLDSILQKLMNPRNYTRRVNAKKISKNNKEETKKRLIILKNKPKTMMQYINNTLSAFRGK
jgi:hypothetical protein